MIVTLFPLADYAAGTYAFGPVTIADDITAICVRLARCTTATPAIWPSASVIVELRPEILIDGLWRPYAGDVSRGGILVNPRTGAEWTHGAVGGYVPPGTGRQLRGTVTIAGGTLRSSASVELI